MTQAETVRLADYRPPAYWVETVHLTFRLAPSATRVVSRIRFRPNEAAPGPFRLNGEQLTTLRVAVDGEDVTPSIADGILSLDAPDRPFTFEAEVEIDPAANTALEGLYLSNGMFCTQCEAEGFRRITWYPDRPDVMAPFTVRIESDLPVLLSNGDKTGEGEGWAEWHDPWPKPSYLFALVAGDLTALTDSFTTMEGRDVTLNIWTRPGPDEGKRDFAMDALKRSMRWDEEAYGRAYDLDVFNIVAVDDFNMGAMENKGLNIFNSSAVLASPETATDARFERIESIVAHEYFHNWTGNRITCRDWFQLCLKEGLTVFRDQQFSADERSAATQRIQDVQSLRARQFREDNGPLAHPVRPAEFVEINNFYTATVYEKGAEVIGMLRTLVGAEGYRRAVDLYFERHDGDAATIEDWLACFEDACGIDLSQFKRWYEQAGTPRVTVEEDWQDGRYTLTLSQQTPPTPGQPAKSPLVIPVAYGLLARDGSEMRATEIAVLDAETTTIALDLPERPVLSVLRGFSAPVIVNHDRSAEERAFLLAHDTDPFARWEAGRALAKDVLARMATSNAEADATLLDALAATATAHHLDPAFRAMVLALPGEDDMAQTLHDAGTVPDPARIHDAREALTLAMARRLEGDLRGLMEANATPGRYDPSAEPAGKRALRGTALGLLTKLDGGDAARAAFASATNMTESLGALSALLSIGEGAEESEAFRERWRDDRLVTDSWFGLQVARAAPARAAEVAQALTERPEFDMRNPNRFRSVFGSLAGNQAGFHHESGAGYRLYGGQVLALDALNPQTAARSLGAFETWRRYDADRQGMIADVLDRILAAPSLSRDSREMASRIRGA